MSIETRASLLMRLRSAEDTAAWADFLAIYEPVIYRLARARGLQDADAREVTQDVLLAVAGAIHRFDPTGKPRFAGWLARITRNAAIDRIRRGSLRGGGGSLFFACSNRSPTPVTNRRCSNSNVAGRCSASPPHGFARP